MLTSDGHRTPLLRPGPTIAMPMKSRKPGAFTLPFWIPSDSEGSIARKTEHAPVQRLGANSLELVALLPPRPPAGVLEPNTIGNLVLLARHRPPRRPDVLLGPVVREVVNANRRQPRLDVRIIWVVRDGAGRRGKRRRGHVLGHGGGWGVRDLGVGREGLSFQKRTRPSEWWRCNGGRREPGWRSRRGGSGCKLEGRAERGCLTDGD